VNLDELKAAIAKEAGLNMENKVKGLCVDCGRPALENCYSEAGRREVAITGLCELCYDKACEEDE
jgi:hypothetical protein